jgi:hypothetical protein
MNPTQSTPRLHPEPTICNLLVHDSHQPNQSIDQAHFRILTLHHSSTVICRPYSSPIPTTPYCRRWAVIGSIGEAHARLSSLYSSEYVQSVPRREKDVRHSSAVLGLKTLPFAIGGTYAVLTGTYLPSAAFESWTRTRTRGRVRQTRILYWSGYQALGSCDASTLESLFLEHGQGRGVVRFPSRLTGIHFSGHTIFFTSRVCTSVRSLI